MDCKRYILLKIDFVIFFSLVPADEEQARARQISAQQMNKLEELWKESPEATVDDLLRGAVNTDEVAQVALRYQDRTEIIQYSPALARPRQIAPVFTPPWWCDLSYKLVVVIFSPTIGCLSLPIHIWTIDFARG